MAFEFETLPIDPQVAAGVLNKADFLRREMRCKIQITTPIGASVWHISINCPTTGHLYGVMDRMLGVAWERVTADWFEDLQKKVPGITRERVGL